MAVSSSSPTGAVMLSALPTIIVLQFILAFLGYDISSASTRLFHKSWLRFKTNSECVEADGA